MSVVIRAENISKQYRLGGVGTGALAHDVNRWWHKMRGKEDPYLKIGDTNDRTEKGNSEYVWALKDINFEVRQGEVLGIIGRNGAGKSTLLKILSRTTTPTTGKIKIKGRIASLLEVGTGFHPELSGRENIFLNGAILGMTKQEIKSKFDEIVDFAGVERYIDTPVKRYSSGMYVRLAFGVAAHLEPEILIVDEVLAVGDAEFQKKALGKMKNVSEKDGRTVLFVSHNLAAVRELCSTSILLANGLLNLSGKTIDVLDHYLKEEVSVSFFEGEDLGNNKGQFLSIRMFDEKGKASNNFTNESRPFITIKYRVNNECSNFNVGLIVTDLLGNHIYSSADTDLNIELLNKKNKGDYFVTVPLPLFNLNTGNFKVTFLMGIIDTELWHSVIIDFSLRNNNYINTGIRNGLLFSLNKWIYS